MNEVAYEWWLETVDEYGDIHESEMAANMQHAVQVSWRAGYNVTLRRQSGNEIEGILSTGYAYMTDGIIETEFSNGFKVPKNIIKAINDILFF